MGEAEFQRHETEFQRHDTEFQRHETEFQRHEVGRDDLAAYSERYDSVADRGYWGDGSIKVEDCDDPVPGPSGRGRVLDIVTMSDSEEDFAPIPLGAAERRWDEISVFSNLAGPRAILGARSSGSSRRQRQRQRQYQPVAYDQILPAGMECDNQHSQRADDDLVAEGEFLIDHYSQSNDYQLYD